MEIIICILVVFYFLLTLPFLFVNRRIHLDHSEFGDGLRFQTIAVEHGSSDDQYTVVILFFPRFGVSIGYFTPVRLMYNIVSFKGQ